MQDTTPEQRREAAYTSGQTAEEVQNGRVRVRESRGGGQGAATTTVAAPTRPHEDHPGELDIELLHPTAHVPDAAPHRDRGRRLTAAVAVLGILAFLVTLVLVVGGSTSTQGEVAPAPDTYTGDWKDTLTRPSQSQPYTGDWKDALTEQRGSQSYTGDWKDQIPGR